MLRLRVKAPFAAFRTFTAGAYRPTAPFLTPSAAYGLILSLSGIESRFDDGHSPMTLMRADLPTVEIALGAVTFPQVHRIYQQLHNYPVGATGKKERARNTKGAKYNIQVARREVLSGLDVYVCVRNNDDIESRIRESLKDGEAASRSRPRYGIPFFGDNNLMIDVLREECAPTTSAYWYRRLIREVPGFLPGRCRLSIWIDRADMTRSTTGLFARTEPPTLDPPEEAWVKIGPPAPAEGRPPVGKRRIPRAPRGEPHDRGS